MGGYVKFANLDYCYDQCSESGRISVLTEVEKTETIFKESLHIVTNSLLNKLALGI